MNDQKEYPLEYTDEVMGIIGDMVFGDDVVIRGSASQSSSLYAGDYDLDEKVRRKGETKTVLTGLRRDFQNIVMKLKSRRDVRIGDIKAGEVPEWRILPQTAGVKDGEVVDYNHNEAHQRIEKLLEMKVLTATEAKEAVALTPADITPVGILKAIDAFKYHIMRWTPAEVLNNKKLLSQDRVYTLEEAFSSPALTKLDVVAYLQGNRFVELSVLYSFYNGSKLLNRTPTDVERSIKESIIGYIAEGKYFKVLKRFASLARLHNKWDVVKELIPVFNGDLGRMALVANDIDTLLFMFENYKSLPETAIRFEVDQFIHRLSNVYDTPEFRKVSANIFRDLHRAVKMPIKSMPNLLGKIGEALADIVNSKAKPLVEKMAE
jgi:predicted transcriptional regulator